MKVLLREIEKGERVVEILPSEFSNIINGPIQTVPIDDTGLWIMCHDEGKILQLPITGIWVAEDGTWLDLIAGNHIIYAMDEEWQYRNLTEEEIERAKDTVVHI